MEAHDLYGCCSALELVGLSPVSDKVWLEELAEISEDAYSDGTKVLVAFTSDKQARAEILLLKVGFVGSEPMGNPHHEDDTLVRVWSARPKMVSELCRKALGEDKSART